MTNKRGLCVFLIINILLLLSQYCFAQSITWQRTYNYYPTNYNDYAYCVCQTTDGNIIIGGTAGNWKIWVIKVNSYGDTIWTREPAIGGANAIVATNDGGCVLTGGDTTEVAFTIKLSSNGDLIWNKSYAGIYVNLRSLINTGDGGFIACGDRYFYNYGLIIKVDSNGNLQWVKYYDNFSDVNLNSITSSVGNNYWVTGGKYKFVSESIVYQTIVLKLNSSGDIILDSSYSINSTTSKGKQIRIINDNILITGYTWDPLYPQGNPMPFILKLDNNGNLIFKRNYNSIQGEYYGASWINNNSFIFATSKPYYINHNSGKAYIVDNNGNIIRQRELNDTGQVELQAIFPLANGDIIFAGDYSIYGPTGHDYFVTRADSLLNFIPIGINNYNNNLPGSFKLNQNYPNPFNPKTNITFDLPKDIDVRLTVYDVLGREVYSINEFRKAGSNKITFDGTNLASGVYYYSLEVRQAGSLTGTFAETRKMVLIK